MITEVSFYSIHRWMQENELLVLLPTDAPKARSEILARLESVTHSQLADVCKTGEQPLLIAPTSGSTGERPSLAVLTLEAVRHSAKTTIDFLGGPALWVSALPTNHIAGFQVVFRSALAGFKPLETAPSRAFFRPEPEFVASFRAARAAGQRIYTSLVPTQLQRCIDHGGLGLELLQQCHGILVGGSAITTDLQQRALELGLPITLTYGMTETAGGCVYNGHPLPGVRVKVKNGVIWLSGQTLLSGYVDSPSPLVEENGISWLVTKDLGKLTNPQGLEITEGSTKDTLTVTGRVDDVIVHGGEKTSAQALTKLISKLEQIEFAYVFGIPSKEWGQILTLCCIVKEVKEVKESHTQTSESTNLVRKLRADLANQVRILVAKEMGAHSVPQFMVELPKIPLSALGKPNGARMRKLATDLWRGSSDGGTDV